MIKMQDLTPRMQEKREDTVQFCNQCEKVVIDNIEINMSFQAEGATLTDKLKLLIQLTD